MSHDRTTIVVQRYLSELAALNGGEPVEPIVRELIGRSADRLHQLCGTMLVRSYPRLMQPPLNLNADELLSAVVDRLLKSISSVKPTNVRQFFALANKHLRWELNDLARRLDQQQHSIGLNDAVEAPVSTDSGLSPNALRILEAIEGLPDEEREVFSLVRIQGLEHGEAATILSVSVKTVQRRLRRALVQLASHLDDLAPDTPPQTDNSNEISA